MLLLCGSSVAAAQSDDERARGHFRAGESYFAQGAHADALREFEAAYRLSGRSLLLLNQATAQERLGDFAGAADSLDAYLEAESDAPEAITLRTRRDNLRGRAAESARAAAAEGDDPRARAAGSAPSAAAERDGPPALDEGRRDRGGLGRLGVTGAAVGGVGVAGAVTAVVLWRSAGAIHAELEDLCGASGNCPIAGIARRIDRGAALSRASTVTWVASGAMLASGVALLLVDLLRPGRRARARGAPVLVGGPVLSGLGLSWRLQ